MGSQGSRSTVRPSTTLRCWRTPYNTPYFNYTHLNFLLEAWCSTEGAITDEAHAEYLRCFRDPEETTAEIRGFLRDIERAAHP